MSSQLKASQTSKHTQPAAPAPRPLPWTTQPYGKDRVLVVDDAGFPVAQFYNQSEADFALRAVNEREELIACLRNLVEFMDKSGMSTTTVGGKDPFKYGGFEYSVVSEARAVLAKVDAG